MNNKGYDNKTFARWLLENLPGSLDIRREDEPQLVFSELDIEESRTPYGIDLRELTGKELFPQFFTYMHKFLAHSNINPIRYDSFVGVPLGATGIADRLSAEYNMDVIVAKQEVTKQEVIQPDPRRKQGYQGLEEKANYKGYFEQDVNEKRIIPLEDVPLTGHRLDNLVWHLRKCGASVDIVLALVERRDRCYETRIGDYGFEHESGLAMVGKKNRIRTYSMLDIETLFEVAQELKLPQLDAAAKRRINQYLEKNSLAGFRFK